MAKTLIPAFLFLAFVVCAAPESRAQTTAFNYQGSLKDGATSANGNYDFEFALFNAISGGNQLGATLSRSSVAVANGIFSVSLDFGSQFPGAVRYLEIRVRLAGQPGITILSPRQQVSSAPYSVKSLSSDTATNASQLGGFSSGSFIQNGTSPQAGTNFNISGTGTADILNAATQYNIGGSRVLSVNSTSAFAGVGAGTTGFANAFYGFAAGAGNTTGGSNAFFGYLAGETNTSGGFNSFFGNGTGASNSTGTGNSFFGTNGGEDNTTGDSNSFFGNNAGVGNSTGSFNTIIGSVANVAMSGLTNTTAIGSRAFVAQSNSMVLGSINGINGATANTFVGIGITAPSARFHVKDGNGNILMGAPGCGGSSSFHGISFAGNLDCLSYSILGEGANTYINTPGGGSILFRVGNIDKMIMNSSGTLNLGFLGSGGSTALCRNTTTGEISSCSSSLRYKKNIASFESGLSFVNKLRPISFDWKNDGMRDVGFGAEDVAKIDPRFVTYNEKGQVEGVKYDRLSVAFVNAFKEQQAQIDRQQTEINELKQVVCELKPAAKGCSPK